MYGVTTMTVPMIVYAAMQVYTNLRGSLGTMLRFLSSRLTTRRYVGLLLSSLPHPLTRRLYFYDLILLIRFHLTASCPVRYASDVAIRSTMYDTHLRATHTTTSSIRGVQIPIYLVSDATDSL